MSVFCLHSKVKSLVDLPSGVPGRLADRLRGWEGWRVRGVSGKLPARRALLFSFLVYGEFFKRERKQVEGRK